MSTGPNFLFIIADQLRADHLACYGNTIVQTPHIDRLSQRGLRFENGYVASPVCMPNRASIMTGRLPSLHGVRHNGTPLGLDATTFVELLRDAGYRTALIGKSHLQNITDIPPGRSWQAKPGLHVPSPELRDAVKDRRDSPAYRIEAPDSWPSPAQARIDDAFYGFEHVEIATMHGDLVGGDYLLWARQRCPDLDKLRGPHNAESDPRYSAPQAWRTRVPEELYPTHYVAERTEHYLREHTQHHAGKPFFVQMSFPDPHHPFTPPGKYWNYYEPAEIPVPASFGQGDLPPLRIMREALAQGVANREGQDPFAVNEREIREIIALTYGMITMIDDAIGRIVTVLEQLHLADNTVLIVTSDHGDFMGDHGIMLKLLLHYQGLIRIPLLVIDPQQKPGNSSPLCSSLDISATVLQRAGIQAYNGIQGRDLLNPDSIPPAGLIIEEDSQRATAGFSKPQRVRTWVTPRWRLSVRHGENWGELYDLENDPHEIVNRWSDPDFAKIRSELQEQLLMQTIAMQDYAPLPTGRA